ANADPINSFDLTGNGPQHDGEGGGVQQPYGYAEIPVWAYDEYGRAHPPGRIDPETARARGAVLNWNGTASYNRADLDGVARHLSTLDHSPVNDAMISRIDQSIANGRSLTEGESNFMSHEMTEAQLMRQGMSYDDAHAEAMKTHPFGKNYDPEVINQFPEYFNNKYRDAWGLPPR
ncbi:hypothetical protein ACIA76_39340, partial [Nocardia sp. NPDC051570]